MLADPTVEAMLEKARIYREFLSRMMKSISDGPLDRDVENVYTIFALLFVLALLYIYLIFMQMNYLPPEQRQGYGAITAAVVVTFPIAMHFVLKPLFAMAEQGSAWERFTKTLKSPHAQSTSQVLSPTKDKFYLFEMHKAMQDDVCWNLFGMEMVPSVIIKFVVAYGGVLFVTIILPQIQAYFDELSANLENYGMRTLNSTVTSLTSY